MSTPPRSLPAFTDEGMLPPGDYVLTLAELAESILVRGPDDEWRYPNWRPKAAGHREDRRRTMIRNETEYEDSVRQLREQAERLRRQKTQLAALNLGKEEIRRAMEPVRSFHDQLKEEVEGYERLKRGEFDEIKNFQGLGQLLVALRVAQGLSQRELAQRLAVHESQVSRDERNEYHGITIERAERVLNALGADVRVTVESLGPERTAAR